MRRFAASNPKLLSIRLALLAAALAIVLVPSLAQAKPTKRVAKQAPNAALGRTVLTTLGGRSLYSLSAETDGRFVCTGTCLSTWHPLIVPARVKPTGPVRLGTTVRPDGRTQVSFEGRPLYSFGGDTRSGGVNGEGIKDVGTWHVVTLGKVVPQPQPQPESPYPY
jgi:predicted lipoprotein with Yx(FWY)xxD motif